MWHPTSRRPAWRRAARRGRSGGDVHPLADADDHAQAGDVGRDAHHRRRARRRASVAASAASQAA